MAPEAAWLPQESGVHQICYLLAQVQKPGTDQGQVRALSRCVKRLVMRVGACTYAA